MEMQHAALANWADANTGSNRGLECCLVSYVTFGLFTDVTYTSFAVMYENNKTRQGYVKVATCWICVSATKVCTLCSTYFAALADKLTALAAGAPRCGLPSRPGLVWASPCT